MTGTEKVRELLKNGQSDAEISELKFLLENNDLSIDFLRKRWHFLTSSRVAGDSRELLEENKKRRQEKKSIIKVLADHLKGVEED